MTYYEGNIYEKILIVSEKHFCSKFNFVKTNLYKKGEIAIMAEFGENIKQKREELGITQQTLADSLFVTRQAVSRWENGSRYPDLLTANKLAAQLGVKLDDLLENDNMQTYAEVNPVIEYPVSKRILTALFASAFSVNLILLLWKFGFYMIDYPRLINEWDTAAYLVGLVLFAVITFALLYGVIKSIRDDMTPQVSVKIITIIVGFDLINQLTVDILNAQNNNLNANSIISLVFSGIIDIVFIVFTILYFRFDKPGIPLPIYIVAGLVIFINSASYIYNLIGYIGTAQLPKYIMISTLRMFAVLVIPALFIYMTAVLHRKRKLAKT